MLWLTLSDLPQTQNALQTLQQRAENLTPLLADLGKREVSRVQKRFEESKAPDGSLWASLKERKDKPLQETGALKASIQTQLLGQGQAVAGVQIGTHLKYASTHQFGRDNIPARPFLGISPELEADILEGTREHFGL